MNAFDFREKVIRKTLDDTTKDFFDEFIRFISVEGRLDRVKDATFVFKSTLGLDEEKDFYLSKEFKTGDIMVKGDFTSIYVHCEFYTKGFDSTFEEMIPLLELYGFEVETNDHGWQGMSYWVTWK